MRNNSDLFFVILAAGQGTRMNSSKPKVLHKIFNTPMIKLLTDNVVSANDSESIIVISEEGQVIKDLYDGQDNINFALQKDRLGTAHAVKIALDDIEKNREGVLIVLYGDTPFISGDTVSKLVLEIKSGKFVAVAGFNTDAENQYGRLIIKDGKLTKIVEFKDATAEEKKVTLCNSGIMAIDMAKAHDLIGKVDNNNKKGEYYLTDIVEHSITSGGAVGHIEVDFDEVQGVNNKIELANATKYYFDSNRKQAMLAGVTLIDPETTYLAHDVKFGKDVEIEPNVVIAENVELGDKVRVRAFSYLESAKLGDEVVVGPYARIRPGTKLGAKAKIGNFVEIKNSELKEGSKVNHLSYVGDAELGSNVNIGAGTITCNYDGFAKHKTFIEDEVFVGSNTALVAPVKVGKGAIVAAGSTITRDIPADSVTIARANQEDINGAAAKYRARKKKS